MGVFKTLLTIFINWIGLRKARLKPPIIVAVICVRYILLPGIGIGVVKAATHFGFLPPDPLYHFVLLIQYTLPPAMNIGMELNHICNILQDVPYLTFKLLGHVFRACKNFHDLLNNIPKTMILSIQQKIQKWKFLYQALVHLVLCYLDSNEIKDQNWWKFVILMQAPWHSSLTWHKRNVLSSSYGLTCLQCCLWQYGRQSSCGSWHKNVAAAHGMAVVIFPFARMGWRGMPDSWWW